MPLSGKEMVKLFEKAGWMFRHQKGSHVIMVCSDGRHKSIPLHRELKPGTEHDLLKTLRDKT